MKKKGTQAYGEVRNKTLVAGSSPERLIQQKVAREGVCIVTEIIKQPIRRGDREYKSSLHAFQIVVSLRYVLDTKKEDELSASLYEMHTAIAASLLKAKGDTR